MALKTLDSQRAWVISISDYPRALLSLWLVVLNLIISQFFELIYLQNDFDFFKILTTNYYF